MPEPDAFRRGDFSPAIARRLFFLSFLSSKLERLRFSRERERAAAVEVPAWSESRVHLAARDERLVARYRTGRMFRSDVERALDVEYRRRCIGSPFAFTVPAANVASSGSALKRHL